MIGMIMTTMSRYCNVSTKVWFIKCSERTTLAIYNPSEHNILSILTARSNLQLGLGLCVQKRKSGIQKMYMDEHIEERMLLAVLGKAISVKMSGLAVKKIIAWKSLGQLAVYARTQRMKRNVTYLISSSVPVQNQEQRTNSTVRGTEISLIIGYFGFYYSFDFQSYFGTFSSVLLPSVVLLLLLTVVLLYWEKLGSVSSNILLGLTLYVWMSLQILMRQLTSLRMCTSPMQISGSLLNNTSYASAPDFSQSTSPYIQLFLDANISIHVISSFKSKLLLPSSVLSSAILSWLSLTKYLSSLCRGLIFLIMMDSYPQF